MNLIKDLYKRNSLLTTLGTINFVLALVLGIIALFNTETILGLNSMIKPMKFSLSIGIYAYTMAWLLSYVNNQNKVKWYSRTAMVVFIVEQFAIISQAFRGELSHFNTTSIYGGILYALMGVFITILTFHTLYIAIVFIFQKSYSISPTLALSIKIGLVLFVVFSFFGGYMSAINRHSMGGDDGGLGLPMLNWSTIHGDLRVPHFFGLHTLQIIPLFGYYISSKTKFANPKMLVWGFTILYLAFVLFTLNEALEGKPFIG